MAPDEWLLQGRPALCRDTGRICSAQGASRGRTAVRSRSPGRRAAGLASRGGAGAGRQPLPGRSTPKWPQARRSTTPPASRARPVRPRAGSLPGVRSERLVGPRLVGYADERRHPFLRRHCQSQALRRARRPTEVHPKLDDLGRQEEVTRLPRPRGHVNRIDATTPTRTDRPSGVQPQVPSTTRSMW